MKKVRYILIFGIILTGVMALGGFALAQPDLGLTEFGAGTDLGQKPLGQIIAEIVRVFLSVLGIIAVILIIYAGFLWMTAAGDVQKVATSKKILINAVIGLAIILASFAITQFIIGALERATGSKIEGAGGPGGPGGGGGLPSGAFVVKGISPQGDLEIRNVVVRISFNHQVAPATVAGNILVMKKSDNSLVSGNFNTIGDKVEFTPDASCPAPNDDLSCFDENTEYAVEVRTDLKDAGGKNLSCGAFAPNCKSEFKTGSLIDAQAPQVEITYPDLGMSVSENSLIEIWARATDDAGVSHLEFFADGAYFDNSYPQSTKKEFNGSAPWDTAGISRGRHSLSARAYDVDNHNSFSPNIDVVIRAEHCFNGIRDEDEADVDCGGADCAICTGGACTADGECVSGSCVNGVCANTPMILNIIPKDGAIGTYVTILGNYFGDSGTVKFLGADGAGDDKIAQLAPCTTPWANNYVIVLVPDGAVSGPIKIETSIGSDSTDDGRGPVISDFLVNNLKRPGICELRPNQGKSGTSFEIIGNGFGKTQGSAFLHFGNVFALPRAWSDGSIIALAPVLKPGDNSVYLERDGVASNALNFKILDATAGTKPTINYIDPDTGPPGEYISIFGNNFGNDIGVVEFLKQDGTRAIGDADFPAICGDVNYWQNTSITVKVPKEFADKTSTQGVSTSMRIKRKDGQTSNSIVFNINNGTPKPGICGLRPNNGPIGTEVDVLGERFGSSGEITFYNQKTAQAINWGKEIIKTRVPDQAVSGPVKIAINNVESNSVNFSVGDCSQNSTLCGLDEQCCGKSCILKTQECQAGPKEGAYLWQISTGIIPKPPRVIEDCQTGENVKNPSPAPWDSRPGGNSVCVNAIVNVRFDSKLDRSTIIYNGADSDTIALYKCIETAQGKDSCSRVSKVAINTSLSEVYEVNNDEDGVQLYPQGGLEKNTQYLVELYSGENGIWGAAPGGGPMEEREGCGAGRGYCFKFKTRNSDDLCKVGSLRVSPGNKTSNKRNELLDYIASVKAKADVCINIDASSYTYNWSSSQPSNADVVGGENIKRDSEGNIIEHKAVVQTFNETLKENPIDISSKIPSENVSGKGELIVDFTDPEVVLKWPLCDSACVNAIIGAEFNTDMDRTTLNENNIKVWKCKTENCNTFDGNIYGTFTLSDKKFEFNPDSNLEISRYYLVRLNTENIRSTSGVGLIGANDGKYYSWKFKTRIDPTPCEVNRVEIEPIKKVLDYIGEIAEFNSKPYGAPDNCNPQGQQLSAYKYDWTWASSDRGVASLVNGGNYNVLPLDGRGCSDRCLNIGSEPGVSVCGNGGPPEPGEDCDDGNIANGDGCSENCLNEGSSLTCGDGNKDKDKGEDCDDGNKKSGDGCSDICLNEGAKAGKSVCGNGDKGDGEDCDDGNTTNGDGCSSDCLNEGTKAGISSCGNGGPPEPGEDCDDGNIANGDGCSENCLNEGTIKPVCGNNVINKGEDYDDGNITNGDGCSQNCLNEGSSLSYIGEPSICGDGGKSRGEDCDYGAFDLNIDPRQYVEAVGKGKTEINAKTKNVTGMSEVEVKCISTTDAQCQASAPAGESLGVGSDNCCYVKARLQYPSPRGTNVCRNALVSFSFNKIMDSASGYISIDQRKGSAPCPEGSTQSGSWCNNAIKAVRTSIDNQENKTTKFIFNISSLLKANQEYRVRVRDFRSQNGVLARNGGWYFTTGNIICKFEKVSVEPNPIIFDKPATKEAVAKAETNNGKEISNIAGVYSWTWGWDASPKKVIDIIADSVNPNKVSITAKAENGEELLIAQAKIIDDDFGFNKDSKVISGSAKVIVFLCENPWPSRAEGFPFEEQANNFSTYYCRDGEKLLPALAFNEVKTKSSPDIIREYLLTDKKSGDAIGIRVYKNFDHLSPLSWYRGKQFIGTPQDIQIDGYEGIVDGRSTYINAANTGSNFTNIFVFSYNQGAGKELQNIAGQILNNLKFNINLNNINKCKSTEKSCSSDLDCPGTDICLAEKEKLTRDTKRLADLNDIAVFLERYKNLRGYYPLLESGTFLRGWAVSTWPSWQAVLGNELGTALSQDPLNKHKSCPEGFDGNTCWNGAVGKYTCNKGSHIYRYELISQDKYRLSTDFEYKQGAEWISAPNSNFEISGSCEGTKWGNSTACGDGIVGEGEDCEKGDISNESCSLNNRSGFRRLSCNASTCKWDKSGECKIGQCGDGVLQSPEEKCDDGQNNGKYGFCNTSCTGLGAYCGDAFGMINGPEECDSADLNGVYNSGCSWDCKIGGPRCGDGVVQTEEGEQCDGNIEKIIKDCKVVDGYQTYRTRTCYSTCKWSAWGACKPDGSCGNGTKEGTEECDDGNNENTDSCTNECKIAKCGDGYIETSKEFCDNGTNNGRACNPLYGLTCNYCSNDCRVITLTGGFCGDGKKEDNEECDGSQLGGKACKDLGYIFGGELQCDSQCNFNVDKCSTVNVKIIR